MDTHGFLWGKNGKFVLFDCISDSKGKQKTSNDATTVQGPFKKFSDWLNKMHYIPDKFY